MYIYNQNGFQIQIQKTVISLLILPLLSQSVKPLKFGDRKNHQEMQPNLGINIFSQWGELIFILR